MKYLIKVDLDEIASIIKKLEDNYAKNLSQTSNLINELSALSNVWKDAAANIFFSKAAAFTDTKVFESYGETIDLLKAAHALLTKAKEDVKSAGSQISWFG